jgi:hypothetical protein
MDYAAAGLTAFYMGRLLCMTFLGTSRADRHTQEHIHESPAVMTIPLVLLAILAALGGWLPVPREVELVTGEVSVSHAPLVALGVAVALALSGLALAWLLYVARPELPDRIAGALGGFYRLVRDKYRVDELYDQLIYRPVLAMCDAAAWVVDRTMIDGVQRRRHVRRVDQRLPAPAADRQRAALRALVPRRRAGARHLLSRRMTTIDVAAFVANWQVALPAIAVVLTACAVMVVDLLLRDGSRGVLAGVGVLGLAVAVALAASAWARRAIRPRSTTCCAPIGTVSSSPSWSASAPRSRSSCRWSSCANGDSRRATTTPLSCSRRRGWCSWRRPTI